MSKSKTPVKAPRKTATKTKVTNKEVVPVLPSRDSVEHLAYLYWVERGRHHGDDVQNWLRAERDIF
jgi:hypothetical protein